MAACTEGPLNRSRQLPRPETQERRDQGDQDADPKWNRLTADDYLHLVQEAEQMEQSKDRKKD